ncbi:MAG: hypothetical protein ACREA0_06780, partial [bacterium]
MNTVPALSRYHIYALVGLAFSVWALVMLATGRTVGWAELKPFSIVVSVVAGGVAVFDRWLWKIPCLYPWFVKTPDISGTWRVTLVSEWVDPDTEEKHGPISCFMTVRQTYSRLSMRLMTAESSSWLIAHGFVYSDDGVIHVTGVYQNEPQIALRGTRSEIHYGALRLEVKGTPPAVLDGNYWTDRNSRGSMKLTDRRK